jgi:hypothetical protein
MDCDPEEIVRLPGRGDMTLRSAVREVMARPAPQRRLVNLYRAYAKEPPILDISHIEQLATRLGF